MRTFAFFAAVLAVTGSQQVFGQNCANPLFDNFQYSASGSASTSIGSISGAVTINVKGNAPAAFPSNAPVCKSFAGQQSCCSADTLNAIATAHTAAQNSLAAARTAISSGIQQNQNMGTSIQQECNTLGLSTSDCSSVQSAAQDLASHATQMATDAVNCASAMETYAVGMLCFACSTNWNQYLNSTASTIDISTGTCTAITNACSPLNADLVAVEGDLMKIMTIISQAPSFAAFGAGAAAFPSASAISATPDLCGGTIANPGKCSANICSQWIAGPSSHMPAFASTAVRVRALLESSEGFAGAAIDAHELVSSHARILASSSSVSNTYSAAGYPAYTSGCADTTGFGCTAPLNVAAIVGGVIAGVAVIVLVVAGVIVYRRRLAMRAHIGTPSTRL